MQMQDILSQTLLLGLITNLLTQLVKQLLKIHENHIIHSIFTGMYDLEKLIFFKQHEMKYSKSIEIKK